MPNPLDMNEPVTRGILRAELTKELNAKLADYPTRAELKAELAHYPTKQYLAEALEAWANTIITLLRGEMRELQKESSRDIANAVKVAIEENRRNLPFLDDKYKDLPPRMAKAEAKVFAPKRRRR